MNRQINACWAYFGRKPLRVEEHGQSNNIGIAVFPAIESGFLKRLFATAPHLNLIVTAGAATIPGNSNEFLIASLDDAPEHLQQGVTVLHCVLEYLVSATMPMRIGDTLDFSGALDASFPMRNFLFLPVPDPIQESALRTRLKPATNVLSLIPISESELQVKKTQGLESLIDNLEASGAATLFDWTRDSKAEQIRR